MNDFKKIVFYNNMRNGDVFLCKEFVREITLFFNLPTYYCHGVYGSKKCFYGDVPLTECDRDKFSNGCFDDKAGLSLVGETVFINTWYFSDEGKYFKKYGGCTLPTLYFYFKDIYVKLGMTIDCDIKKYLPKIDLVYYKNKIDHTYLNDSSFLKKILICNNYPMSGQSSRDDWSMMINILSLKYPKYLFLVTNDGNYNIKNNLVKTNLLYNVDYNDKNDLMEISYISTFCDVIVGRGSGPFSCCLTRHNFFTNKKMINVSYNLEEATFGLSSEKNNNLFVVDAKKNYYEIMQKIEEYL